MAIECLLLEDCCASLNPEFHRISVERIEAIFGWISNSTELLQAITL